MEAIDGSHAADPPLVAIACQGGGSHAAFGAGVLYRLLEDSGHKFRLAALSGTSGGAINAALAWSGLIQGGQANGLEEARRRLKGMWEDLGASDLPDAVRNWWGQVVLNLPFTWEISPYVWDLGVREEMVRRLEKWVALEKMPKDSARLSKPHLLVGTTDILNGVSAAIRGDGEAMTRRRQNIALKPEPFGYEDIIASMAIPPLYRDVPRRGTAFWDGLFSINPPINALTNLDPRPQEIWVVQINPQRAARQPTGMRNIADRRNELGGNVSLNKELDMIENVNDMLGRGLLQGSHYTTITLRIIGLEEGPEDQTLTYASKFDRTPDFLRHLFDRGRLRAPSFYQDTSLRDRFTVRVIQSPPPAR
jgi:NTE family protein